MSTSISFLGQSIAQTARLQQMRTQLADLQRQATTQKKYENMAGFGFASLALQRNRMETDHIDSYLSNIQTASTRINVMNQAMTQAADLGRDFASMLTSQAAGGDIDIATIKEMAKNNLAFLQDLTNTQIDGRYVFAGSSTQTQPFVNGLQVNTTYQNEVTNWLNGTTTTSQLLANSDSLSATGLGFAPQLSSAGAVAVRANDNLEIDYTVIGNANGFDDLMRVFAFCANLEAPDPATDVPTKDDMGAVISALTAKAHDGVESLDAATAKLGGKYNLISTLQENHTQDKGLYQKLVDETENVDTTEVITKLQLLQTQMQASYQVTSIVSQLSLVNYLNI